MTPPAAPPVVFVHGWGSTAARCWGDTALMRDLARAGRRVIGVDLMGHGRQPVGTPAPLEPAAYAGIADDLASRLPADEVLDGVGFSLGGKLLLELACRHMGWFRKLVIVGVGENAFRPEDGSAVAAALSAGLTATISPVLRPVIAEALASGNDPRALTAAIRRPPAVLTATRLQRVTATVLVAVGDGDVIAGSTAPLLAALPDARAVTLPGADHVSSPQSPLLAARSMSFLRAEPASSRVDTLP
jgi:pimeloyl-ACP methyl ester carboxylesterase